MKSVREIKESLSRSFEVTCPMRLDYGNNIIRKNNIDYIPLKRVIEELEGFEKQWRGSGELLEKLADLEHRQWSHWLQFLCSHGYMKRDPKVTEWLKQARTPYTELSEEEKEKDRRFARCVLALIEEEFLGE